MHKILSVLLLAVLLAACAPSAQQIQAAIDQTQQANATALPTAAAPIPTRTIPPSFTPPPTRTVGPSETPVPTKTPLPTRTATPPPQPVEFSGTGDQIVDFDNPFGFSTVHLTHQGRSNFIVHSVNAANENIGSLANAIGNYDGYRLLDLHDDDHTKRFSVKADGPWTITVYPLAIQYTRFCEIPGVCEGKGDDVIAFHGGTPDTITFIHEGQSNFIVHSLGNSFKSLVNEIGPYTGTVLVPGDAVILEILADGKWTAAVTTR